MAPTSAPGKIPANGAGAAFLRRWLGPSVILIAGLASLGWSRIEPLPSPVILSFCHLAAAGPPAETPFLAENDAAMYAMTTRMTIQPTGDADHDFVEMMVPHHQAALDMARALLRYGHNETLRRLAQEIIVTQQQEIATMRLALGEPLPPAVAAPDQLPSSRKEP